jgi:hypothetical protein
MVDNEKQAKPELDITQPPPAGQMVAFITVVPFTAGVQKQYQANPNQVNR